MTKKERALIDEIEAILFDEIFPNTYCSKTETIIKISNIIFKLKFPKLSKSDFKNIEIQ